MYKTVGFCVGPTCKYNYWDVKVGGGEEEYDDPLMFAMIYLVFANMKI